MPDKYLTISSLTRYLKFKFDSDENLRNVYLRGEISNFKSHTTGHYYFSLKDETSKINAIMFKNNTLKLNFKPEEGMKVLVEGVIRIYEATGSYQIYVNDMIEDGVGNLHIAFEKLKEQLSKEGLFDPKYKKSIPKIPTRIGIVTAKTGAAIKDIMSTIERRFPICSTYLFPCLVQGENASIDIVKKIKQADGYGFDCLIVGRGGGSFEDLNCFNQENVARAIFEAKTPIISAVGHEIDFTIADFVSDLRAPTPTGAAEMAVPNLSDIQNSLNQYNIRLNEAILKKVKYLKLYLESVKNSYALKNPNLMFDTRKQRLDMISENLSKNLLIKIDRNKVRIDNIKSKYVLNNPESLYKDKKINLKNIIDKLELLNPLSILKRGYTVTYKDNKIIKNINDISKNDIVNIRINDGYIDAKVIDVRK